MRRIASLLLALLLLGIAPVFAETVSGTGEAQGFGGAVSVTITLTDGVMTEVVAQGDGETEGIGSKALESLPAAMVEGNTIAVDALSGATITSAAVLEAAAAALTEAGVNFEDYMTKVEDVISDDMTLTADVVVVGAGGAGMVAAITAADAGKEVVILESQPIVGGNSVKATGGMNAAKTSVQDENSFEEAAGVEKTLGSLDAWADNTTITDLGSTVADQWAAYQSDPVGYFDSQELMALDTMIGGKGINDPVLVETFVGGTAEGVEWLKSIDIDLNGAGALGGASVKRNHFPVVDGKKQSVGAYMVPRLEKALLARDNIILLTDTTAHTILAQDGAACGILATGESGNTVTVNAKAVVMTTGGFGANLPMVASYAPQLEGFMTTNAAGIQGQGIFMAQAIGADTVDMEQIQIHPTVEANTASLITEGLRGDGAILVNAEGKRFIDEVGTRDVVSAAEIAQPGSFSWLVVDQAMLDGSSVIAGYVSKGLTIQGDTYEALAEAIGVDAETFAKTMNDWNACVEAKDDPEFGRTSFTNPLNTAPFYAVKVTAGIHHTMGGLKINTDTQVLNTEGMAIPGLYAAGEVTGGIHGANRLGGNAVADFVVFGRIAGAEASAFAG